MPAYSPPCESTLTTSGARHPTCLADTQVCAMVPTRTVTEDTMKCNRIYKHKSGFQGGYSLPKSTLVSKMCKTKPAPDCLRGRSVVSCEPLLQASPYCSFGPASTSDLPRSLPVNFSKFLMKRPARSLAFVSHSAGSAYVSRGSRM